MSDGDVIKDKPLYQFNEFARRLVDQCRHHDGDAQELSIVALKVLRRRLKNSYGNEALTFLADAAELIMNSIPVVPTQSFDWSNLKRKINLLAQNTAFSRKRAQHFVLDAVKRQLDAMRVDGSASNLHQRMIERYLWNIFNGDCAEILRSVEQVEDVPRHALVERLDEVECHLQREIPGFASKWLKHGDVKKIRICSPRPYVDLSTTHS